MILINCRRLKKNKLSVISFNYDTLFMDAFLHFLTQDEVCMGLSDAACPNIYHVFGSFGEIRKTMNMSQIESDAEKLFFMGEEHGRFIENRKIVREVIESANKVLLVGFDCHPDNAEMIGLSETDADI